MRLGSETGFLQLDSTPMTAEQARERFGDCSEYFDYLEEHDSKKDNKDIVVYLSKADILEKKKVDDFCKKYKAISDADLLKEKIELVSKKVEKEEE